MKTKKAQKSRLLVTRKLPHSKPPRIKFPTKTVVTNPMPSSPDAISDSGKWKSGVDLTLARHGKELSAILRSMITLNNETHANLEQIRVIREDMSLHRMLTWTGWILAALLGVFVLVR